MAEPSPTSDADRHAAERQFAERVTRYLDDALSADELAALNRELATDAGRRERFVELCIVESMVAEEFSQQSGAPSKTQSPSETSTWSGLAALSIGPVDADDWRVAPFPQRRQRRVPWLVGGGLAAAASVLIAAGVAWPWRDGPAVSPTPPTVALAPAPVPPSQTPSLTTPPAPTPPIVAVAGLGDTREAAWDGPDQPAGSRFLPGTTLALTRGVAAVTFDQGATVFVEGPARFSVDSPTALTLASGKLFATAGVGGFVVTTPDAVVTDLGTEFGVTAAAAGGSRVEVFRGRVRVEGRGSAAGGLPLTLDEGQAADVASTLTRDAAGSLPQHFVRTLRPSTARPVTLDVVDLVAGGDGTGHRRGRGIDALTGQGETTPTGSFIGKHGYQRAAGAVAIDGTFVPDQNPGPTTVDSAGHSFTFPVTDNHSFALIWAGGAIPSKAGYPARPTTLAGTDYATAGHGLLAMDSNKGVTFDLNALRRLNPQLEPVRIRCGVGNTYVGVRRPNSKADVWVLVDGKVKFERRGLTVADGVVGVDVAIGPNDRFVSVVTTDGGDSYSYDWVLWVDPLLELRPL